MNLALALNIRIALMASQPLNSGVETCRDATPVGGSMAYCRAPTRMLYSACVGGVVSCHGGPLPSTAMATRARTTSSRSVAGTRSNPSMSVVTFAACTANGPGNQEQCISTEPQG